MGKIGRLMKYFGSVRYNEFTKVWDKIIRIAKAQSYGTNYDGNKSWGCL